MRKMCPVLHIAAESQWVLDFNFKAWTNLDVIKSSLVSNTNLIPVCFTCKSVRSLVPDH